MTVLSIICRKGGCGKTTLATSIAIYLTRKGHQITLIDSDPQNSIKVWLSRRPIDIPTPAIGSFNLSGPSTSVCYGTRHAVVDSPGGIKGLQLSKLIMKSDLLLIPVPGSVFDRASVSDFWDELKKHPRIIAGRCRVAAIGMRLDAENDEDKLNEAWAHKSGITWLGWIRRSSVYVRASENGMSIFDMPSLILDKHIGQFDNLFRWLEIGGFLATPENYYPEIQILPAKSRFVKNLPNSTLKNSDIAQTKSPIWSWLQKGKE